MNRIFKIILTVVTVISLGLLLYFEGGLITTKHCTTSWLFAPLEKIKVKILGPSTILLLAVTSNFYIKSKREKLIVFSSFSIAIVGLTLTTLNLLDKSEKTIYRGDFGLQPFYLYLDDGSKDYILEYTWPFGKSTIVGHFEKTANNVELDRDIVEALNLKGIQFEKPIISLNLEEMKKKKKKIAVANTVYSKQGVRWITKVQCNLQSPPNR